MFVVGIAAVTPLDASSTSVIITETHQQPSRQLRGLEPPPPPITTLTATREHWTQLQESAVEPLQYSYGYHKVSSTPGAIPSMIVRVDGDTLVSVRPYYYGDTINLDPAQYVTVEDFFD